MVDKIKTTKTTPLSKPATQRLQDKVFKPLENLIDTKIKKEVREPLQGLQIQYLKLNDQLIDQYNILITNISRDVEKLRASLEAQVKDKDPDIGKKDLAKFLNTEEQQYLRERFGALYTDPKTKEQRLVFSYKGKPVTLDQLKKLAGVADATKPANFEQITVIGKVLGIDPNQWEKGHESASVLSIKIAGLLRSTKFGPNNPVNRDTLRKLLDVSRQIDHIDDTILKPYLDKTISPATGFEIIGSLVDSNLDKVSIDSTIAKEIVEDLNSGKVTHKFTVTFEAKNLNQIKGKLSGVLGSILTDILSGKEITKEANAVLAKVNAANLTGSPTTISIIDRILTALLLNKKNLKKPKKQLHKAGSLKLVTEKFKSKKAKKVSSKTPNNTMRGILANVKQDPKISSIDTFNLKELINNILAKSVEQQMASAGDTSGRLRYQTGRFADSAELLTLTRTKAGILAGTYTYQRNPYDVFLPGHKMANGKRDPRIYVEGAIRESAMAILKNKFPGIQMGLQ